MKKSPDVAERRGVRWASALRVAAPRGILAVGVLSAAAALRTPSRALWLLAPIGAVLVASGRAAVRAEHHDLEALQHRQAWLPLVAGEITLLGGEVLRLLGAGGGPSSLPVTSASGAVAYPLIVVGLVRLTRRNLRESAFAIVTLAAFIPLGLGFLAGLRLLDGTLPTTSPTGAAGSIASLMIGALATVIAARLALLDHGETGTYGPLATGLTLLLAAQSARAVTALHGATIDPPGAAACALLGFAALGAAGLRAQAPADRDAIPRAVPLGVGRLSLLGGAVILGPAMVVRESQRGGRGVSPAAIAAACLSLLAVIYLARLLRERTLLEHHALHDDLTGLPNRALFRDRLVAALRSGRRDGAGVAVLFLDLDRFKQVNDSLGHAAGNELLRQAAARLHTTLGAAATMARLGGDEFSVLVVGEPGAASKQADATALVLLREFVDPFVIEGRTIFITPSIGIAISPDHGTDVDTLLRNADAAMYDAKARGRNRSQHYTDEMHTRAAERLALETSLHAAIDHGELVLHYQPKVDLRTGRIVGTEALVRWLHPELGLVPPDSFIGLAEETGLIIPLGEWVLEEACGQTKRWQDQGLPAVTVAVNLSARQFQQQAVPEVVAEILRRTGLAAQHLELELTESLAMESADAIGTALRDLVDMGVQCSIDDFGTGYSALSYLTRFPIQKLKIDKSFVDGIRDGEDDSAIVRAVIALAHTLRLEVVAEGVETEEQLCFLRDHGCDVMQGFYFSRPLPSDQFEALLLTQAALTDAPVSIAPAAVAPPPLAPHGTEPARPTLVPAVPGGNPDQAPRLAARARTMVATSMVIALPLTGGLAGADMLPAPMERIAATVLETAGLTSPPRSPKPEERVAKMGPTHRTSATAPSPDAPTAGALANRAAGASPRRAVGAKDAPTAHPKDKARVRAKSTEHLAPEPVAPSPQDGTRTAREATEQPGPNAPTPPTRVKVRRSAKPRKA